MTRSEERMIGYCGYKCYLCAARSDDINVRQKLVDAWRKYLGHENYNAENVACDGCKSKGEKIADKQCRARPCCRLKGLENCAQCDDFPCDKVKHLLTSSLVMLTYRAPQFRDVTEEEFNLSVQQWDSIPNLIKILVEEGKLPSFILNRV